MRHKVSLAAAMLAGIGLLTFGTPTRAFAQGDQSVYADALTSNWQNWSWCTTDFNSHDYVHAGAASVKVTYTAGWQAFYLHCTTTDTTNYASITFWINGGATTGRNLGIAGIVNGTAGANVPLAPYISGGKRSGQYVAASDRSPVRHRPEQNIGHDGLLDRGNGRNRADCVLH